MEGSARESKRDYLHFLYIARGSLSETQYFLHLSHRLGYLSDSNNQLLGQQVKVSFGCLHGLIRAVERESRKLAKGAALLTSGIILSLARLSAVFGQ